MKFISKLRNDFTCQRVLQEYKQAQESHIQDFFKVALCFQLFSNRKLGLPFDHPLYDPQLINPLLYHKEGP